MKLKYVKAPRVGDKVVVASNDDTQVYLVAEVDGHTAKLNYFNGHRVVSGGQFPSDCLYQPTKAQLDNSPQP